MNRLDSMPERIYALISKNSYGLTIEEVSSQLHINRATASKYLAVLEAKNKIIVRELGKAKLHYPRTKTLEGKLR